MHGDGVAEDLAHQPIADMPQIPCPDLLEVIPLDELREGRFDPPAPLAERRAPLRIGIEALVAERGFEHETVGRKRLGQVGGPVVPIGQQCAFTRRHDLGQQRQIRLIGTGQTHRLDPPRPVVADMETEAIKGLAGGMVTAIAGRTSKATAPMRTGESTDRNRHTIDERDRIGPFTGDELMPELVLERPQVGGLTDKGRAMNVRKRREEMAVISLKILKDRLILFVATEQYATLRN